MQHRQNSSGKEEDSEQQQYVKTLHQQVKLLGKQHEQMSTEAKNTKESMATLEARVNDMRHEQSKLKDNECTEKEIIHAQIAIVNKKMMEKLGKDLEELRLAFNTMKATALNSWPSFKHSEGASSPARSASGSRELRSTVNSKAASGASPREISIPFEGRRVHVGMCEGDKYCPDCKGFVWRSRSECDSNKCQRRRQKKKTSTTTEV
jgi:hypothetical protein